MTTLPFALIVLTAAQEAPLDIPRKDLPKTAICVVCTANGEDHGEERPAAGVRWRGQAYYFCNEKELPEFKKDPQGFLPPVVPRPAPAVVAKELDGRAFAWEAMKGKVILLGFWATWNAPSVASMPELEREYNRLRDRGLVVLGVSVDEDPKKVPPFLQKRKLTYPILLDDAKNPTWAAFRVRTLPAMVLVGRDGQILGQWRGKFRVKEVIAEVEKALENRD